MLCRLSRACWVKVNFQLFLLSVNVQVYNGFSSHKRDKKVLRFVAWVGWIAPSRSFLCCKNINLKIFQDIQTHFRKEWNQNFNSFVNTIHPPHANPAQIFNLNAKCLPWYLHSINAAVSSCDSCDMLSFTNIIIFNEYYDFFLETHENASNTFFVFLTLYPNVTEGAGALRFCAWLLHGALKWVFDYCWRW